MTPPSCLASRRGCRSRLLPEREQSDRVLSTQEAEQRVQRCPCLSLQNGFQSNPGPPLGASGSLSLLYLLSLSPLLTLRLLVLTLPLPASCSSTKDKVLSFWTSCLIPSSVMGKGFTPFIDLKWGQSSAVVRTDALELVWIPDRSVKEAESNDLYRLIRRSQATDEGKDLISHRWFSLRFMSRDIYHGPICNSKSSGSDLSVHWLEIGRWIMV